jgi:hypothetical protein
MTKRKPKRAPKAPPKPRRPGLLGPTRIAPSVADLAELAADEAMLRAKGKLPKKPTKTGRTGDDLDRSIAQRTAKNKNFPALVDDAQRAKAWQLEQLHALIDRIDREGFTSVPRSETDAIFAQQRAQAFNADEQIAEHRIQVDYLEALTRLQKQKIKELKQSVRVLLAHVGGTRKATVKQIERARWRLEH